MMAAITHHLSALYFLRVNWIPDGVERVVQKNAKRGEKRASPHKHAREREDDVYVAQFNRWNEMQPSETIICAETTYQAH
jgi:hypothetical protein